MFVLLTIGLIGSLCGALVSFAAVARVNALLPLAPVATVPAEIEGVLFLLIAAVCLAGMAITHTLGRVIEHLTTLQALQSPLPPSHPEDDPDFTLPVAPRWRRRNRVL
jgi:hypothetical protein